MLVVIDGKGSQDEFLFFYLLWHIIQFVKKATSENQTSFSFIEVGLEEYMIIGRKILKEGMEFEERMSWDFPSIC